MKLKRFNEFEKIDEGLFSKDNDKSIDDIIKKMKKK